MENSTMEEERTISFFRFEDLRIYDKALAYVEWVYKTTKLFPETGPIAGVASRYLQAAHDIAISIAEGSGRNKPQFVMLLKDARASARECLVLGTTTARLHYLSDEKLAENRDLLIEISKMLGALITSLQKSGRRNETRNSYDDESQGQED